MSGEEALKKACKIVTSPEFKKFLASALKDYEFSEIKRLETELENVRKLNIHQMADLREQLEQAERQRDELVKLLKLAKCPDEYCKNGTVCDGQISEDEWQYHQCQWCFERNQALAEGDK